MQSIKIGVTMGDPAGIGPEIIAKAVIRPEISKLGRIVVIGDGWVFDKVKGQSLGVNGLRFIDLNNVSRKSFRFGRVKAEYGRAAIEYLKKAVELVKDKEIDCLVTAPISKEAINLADYKYNGHTEFLAQAFGRKKDDIVMMLLNKYLKISLATRHLPLKRVSSALSKKRVYKTIAITYKAMKEYFRVDSPKICVAALNPHAGEAGILGKEEIEQIQPGVKMAKRLTKDISGPMSADVAFTSAKQGRFDVVIAMYHDQALIPLKTLDAASGVNLTLGLGFVRTSPLHGTGFDIAGNNIASDASLIAAINRAVECAGGMVA